MGRSWFDLEIFERNVRRLERHIRFVHQFIYGCPGDNYDSFRKSIAWAVEANRDVWFDRLQVLPGTVYRQAPSRFGLLYERSRPHYASSSSTFSAEDMRQADDLKRGFLLYSLREVVDLVSLRDLLGADTMTILERFGRWCGENVPVQSLGVSRADPESLPIDLLDTLSLWIGSFLQSTCRLDETVRRKLDIRRGNMMSATRRRLRLRPSLAGVKGN
jgi:hypothetical protein